MHIAQRRIAGSIVAVGEHDQRRALAVARRDERQRRDDRVVDRRRTPRLDRLHDARRRGAVGSPSRKDVRLMIERENRKFVGGIQGVGDEPRDRFACLIDSPAEHAVAGIEQDAEADRDALVGELGHLLR